MAYADGNIIIGTSVDMYGMNTGLKKIQASVRRLSLSLGATLGVGALVKLGKEALNAASDLQEVQNVVDVSFEDMSWKVEKFAETCIDKFGMSELSAKQTAGSFMAMGRAMDLTKEEASNMAVKLTALTGDFASFYNISQDYARVALSAVYTGETETLKRYGIILTEANLQEYAHTLGIEKKVKAMSAREKLLLRYNYILKATSLVEGDFVRTQNTWANQLRVLKERWKQLLIVMGNGLITILTPMLQALNKLVAALIKFANTLGRILSRLFGIKWQDMSAGATGFGDSIGGAADSLGDLSEAEDDLGSSAEKAGKKMHKQLQGFDELNNLTTNAASSTGGLGDALGGLADGLDADDYLGDLLDGKGLLEDNFLPDVQTLFDLGRELAKRLADMLENIDWDSIYAKAKRFGSRLADLLNGLLLERLWYDLGSTLAKALNAALYAAIAFAERFNWSGLGRAIAAGINGFFENFDFQSLAHGLNVWLKGLLDALISLIHRVDWALIGTQIGTFLANIDYWGIAKRVIQVIWEAFKAAFDLYGNLFREAPIQTIILSVAALGKVLSSAKIKNGIKLLSTFFTALTTSAATKSGMNAITSLRQMSPLLGGMIDSFTTMQLAGEEAFISFSKAFASGKNTLQSFGAGIKGFTDTTSTLLSPAVKAIGGFAVGLAEFAAVFANVKSAIVKGINGENIAKEIGAITIAATTAAAALAVIFGIPAGLLIGGAVAAAGALAGVVAAVHELDEMHYETALQNMFNNAENTTHKLSDYVADLREIQDNLTQGSEDIFAGFENLDTARSNIQDTIDIIDGIGLAMTTNRELTEEEVAKLGQAFESLKEYAQDYVNAYYDTMIAQSQADLAYKLSSAVSPDEIEAIKSEYADTIQTLYELKDAALQEAEVVSTQQTEAWERYTSVMNDNNASVEEQAKAQAEWKKAAGDSLEYMANIGAYTNEANKAFDEGVSSIEKYRGQLDLSGSELADTQDLVADVKATVGEMTNVYEDTQKLLQEDLDKTAQELSHATGKEAEELQKHIDVTQEKLTTLRTTYGTELEYLQGDIAELLPRAMEAFSEEYDALSPFEKWFAGDKATYVAEKSQQFIDEVFGENGLSGELQGAYDKLGADNAVWADEFSNNLVNSMFNVDSISGSGTILYEAATPEIESALNDTKDFAEKTIDAMDIEGYTQQRAEDFSKGFALGMNDEESHSALFTAITTWGQNIYNWVHDGILNFGSPSETMKTFGRDTVLGYNMGIDESKSTTDTSLALWMESISTFFTGILEFINTEFLTGWSTAWNNVLDVLTQVWENIPDFIRGAINSIIGFLNGLISGIANGLNFLVDALNGLSLDIPDWVPGIGGNKIDFNLSRMNIPQIPLLAKGAVIPPNAPFMAMLGDQRNGTNIEAPLDTIKQALSEVMLNAGNGVMSGDIIVQIDGREVFRAVRNQNDIYRKSTGSSAFSD